MSSFLPACRPVLRRRMRPICDHIDLLEGDESAADHSVELREDGVDSFRSLDALHDDWQIERQHFDAIRADPGAGAEAHDRAKDSGTRVVVSAKQLDDGGVERLAFELVTLSDVDSHQHPLTLQSVHDSSPPLSRAMHGGRSDTLAKRDQLAREKESAERSGDREDSASQRVRSCTLVLPLFDERRRLEAVGLSLI